LIWINSLLGIFDFLFGRAWTYLFEKREADLRQENALIIEFTVLKNKTGEAR
jgi:hypothetical protein